VDDDSPRTLPILDIYSLYFRHPGMAKEIADNLAVNAAVCMERHSRSPRTWSVRADQDHPIDYVTSWEMPTPAQVRACANQDDATRDGAYGLALAAIDVHLGYVALRRAEGRTGVDFYVIPAGTEVSPSPDLDIERDDLVGFEVSGISDDTDSMLRTRVNRKIEQVRSGKLPFQSIVGVVGFRSARIVFRRVEG
jgi:hypothetical protein